MNTEVIRTMSNPPSRLLPSEKVKGIVQQISVELDADGFHVLVTETLWTRNRRRRDERGEVVSQAVLLKLTAQEAATFMTSLTWTLLHVDSRGPK